MSLVGSDLVQKQGIKGKAAVGEVETGLNTDGKPVKILAVHELLVRCGDDQCL